MTSDHPVRNLIGARLQPAYLVTASVAIIMMSIVMACMMFRTSADEETMFGVPLGADFSGFYVAAQILNQGQPQSLYDRTLHHRLYHELFPFEDEQVSIPYVHPPFVAGMLRPLALLPYRIAFAIWLGISATLYIASICVILWADPWPIPSQRWLILLLALSFEPFALECWLGGQLSAVGALSYAVCFAFLQSSRPTAAGMALGVCFYKPTLLILVLPLLVIGRQWRMLLGMTVTGILLACLSFAFVGADVSLSYIKELLTFNQSAAGGDLDIRTWKYVDFRNSVRLILGVQTPFLNPILVGISIVPFAILAWRWWVSGKSGVPGRRPLWAATLAWIPLLNLYFGIYDSILIVQAIYITANSISTNSKVASPLIDSGFAYLVLLIAGSAWLNQYLAAKSGIPIYSILLTALGVWHLVRLSEIDPHPGRFGQHNYDIR